MGYTALKKLERDICQFAHKENNVLFLRRATARGSTRVGAGTEAVWISTNPNTAQEKPREPSSPPPHLNEFKAQQVQR